MGGVVSFSSNITSSIQILKQENCPPDHQVWNNFSIKSIGNFTYSPEIKSLFLEIKENYPNNLAHLIKVTVDAFSKASKISDSENVQNPSFIGVCNFICFLLSISHEPPQNSPWFKMPGVYLSALSPISTLIQTLQRLLQFSQPINQILQNNLLSIRLTYVKTLLFIQNADSLNDQPKAIPTPYMLSFETFQSSSFLPTFFHLIPEVLLHNKSPQAFHFIKSLVTFSLPSLLSCNSWRLQNIDQNIINHCFSPLLQVSSYSSNSFYVIEKVKKFSDYYITLLLVIMHRFPTFIEFISVYDLSNDYISSILFLYEIKYEEQNITFFHTLILLILSKIISNYSALIKLNTPFVGVFNTNLIKPHRGTVSDLIIEVITNPLNNDNFDANISIVPFIIGIITNLSATTANLSYFSANRIFVFAKKMFSNPKVNQNSIEYVLISLFQFLRFQPLGKVSLFMFCSTNKKNLQIVGNNNKFKNIVEKILSIINAGEKALHIKNEKEKLLKLQNSIAPILNEFNEDPIPQKEFEINNKLNEVLFDWFKVLFWKIFPEEAENFGLQIKSFEMPKKYEIEVGNKEVNEDENEDKNIEIVPKEKSEVKTEFERFLEEQIAAEEENESENGENEIAQNDILSEQIPNPFGEDDELSKFLDEK